MHIFLRIFLVDFEHFIGAGFPGEFFGLLLGFLGEVIS